MTLPRTRIFYELFLKKLIIQMDLENNFLTSSNIDDIGKTGFRFRNNKLQTQKNEIYSNILKYYANITMEKIHKIIRYGINQEYLQEDFLPTHFKNDEIEKSGSIYVIKITTKAINLVDETKLQTIYRSIREIIFYDSKAHWFILGVLCSTLLTATIDKTTKWIDATQKVVMESTPPER